MSISDKLLRINAIRKDLFAATREKGFDTANSTFENLHERWASVIPVKYQTKNALLDDSDVEVLPDSGYSALNKVIVKTPSTLLPENIREGITICGVKGTMRVHPSSSIPDDFRSADPNNPDPGSLEEALTLYKEYYGEFEGDMFLHVDDEGRRCYGFMVPQRDSGQKLYANNLLLPPFEHLWDRETYPYAFLTINFYSVRDPYSWRVRLEMLSRGNGYSVLKNASSGSYRIKFERPKWRQYDLKEDTWVLVDEGDGVGTTIQVSVDGVKWSSHSYSRSGTEVLSAGGEGVPCEDFVIPVYDGESTVFQPIGLRELVFNAGKYGRYQQGSWWLFDFTHVRTDLQETSLRLGSDLRICHILSCGRTLKYNDEVILPNISDIEEASL